MSFNNYANRYTIYGLLFGLFFPVIASLVDLWVVFDRYFDLEAIIMLQKRGHLHWIINTAPFFLGIFARFIGMAQDKVVSQVNELRIINNKFQKEIKKRKNIEEMLLEKRRIIDEQLAAAKTIQESFLPELPKNNLVKLGYRYLPMEAVGGDFISLLKLREGGISIFIGDVTGHGVSAALICSLVNVLANKTGRTYGHYPKKYLKALNNELIEYLPECNYLTAVYGIVSKDEHNDGYLKFVYSRGAHPYPLLYHADTGEVDVKISSGVPLGFVEDNEYDELTMHMKKKDRLFLFTDGIIEAENNKKEIFDFERLIAAIKKADQKNYNVEETLDFIINKVKNFCGELPVHDDQLLLCIEAK